MIQTWIIKTLIMKVRGKNWWDSETIRGKKNKELKEGEMEDDKRKEIVGRKMGKK